MKQVRSDDKFINSPSPSPKDSPNHLVATRKVGGTGLGREDEGGGARDRGPLIQLQGE